MKKIKNNRCGYQKHWVAVPGMKNGGFCRRNPNTPASFSQETHANPHSADLLKAIGISAGTLTIAGVGFGAAMLLTRTGREKAVADANMAAVHEATAKVTAEYEAKFKDLTDRHQKDLEAASKAHAPTTPPSTPISPVDEAKTAELEKNLAAARAAHEELSQQHDRLQEEANTLKETLSKAETDHERTRSELDKATAALTNHQKEIDFLRSKAGESEDLQKRLIKIHGEKADLEATVAQHGRDLQSNAETIETLNQNLQQHQSTIEGLAAEREALKGQIKTHEETIAKAKVHIKGLNQTLRGHQATIEGQGNMIIQRTAERDELRTKHAALQDKLNSSEGKLTDLHAAHQALSAQHGELTQSFEQQLAAREAEIKQKYETEYSVLQIERDNAVLDEIERLRKQNLTEIAQIRAYAEAAIVNANRYAAVQFGKDPGLLIDHTPAGSTKTNGGIQFAASVRKNNYPIQGIETDTFLGHVKNKTDSLISDLSNQVITGSGSRNVLSVNAALLSFLKNSDNLTISAANTAFSQTEERERALKDIIATVKRKAIQDSTDAAASFHEAFRATTQQSDRDKLIDNLDKRFRQIYQQSRKLIYDNHTRIMSSNQYSLRGVLGSDGEPVTQPAWGIPKPKRIQGDSYMSNYLARIR